MRRLLPEWAAQSAVLLAWPDEATDWAPFLPDVRSEYRQLIAAIARREKALVLVRDAAAAEQLRESLDANIRGQVFPVLGEYDDTWTRDYGPLTVADRDGLCLVDCAFDGWGGKFRASRDNGVTRALHANGLFGDIELTRHARVLEGGALDTDGDGVALCNRDTFAAREPNASTGDLESWLRETLGLAQVLWLHDVQLEGDDTDGHVDTLARFAGTGNIVFQACEDRDDEHFAMLRNLSVQLSHFRTAQGAPYILHALPWPQAVVIDGRRLPASYANFLVINDAVLVPSFDDPADGRACEVIKGVFPDRDVVSIPSSALLRQFGGVHCITMQLPAGVPVHAPSTTYPGLNPSP
jgi:agmatine/peptidylarginine deiminase